MSRREFIKLCGILAAVLGLPASAVNTISNALAAATRLPVIWLEFQDCTGDSGSFLRAYQRFDLHQPSKTDPGITSLILDVLSVDYHETLMAPAGFMAEKSRQDTIQSYGGKYICVVEGSIPAGNNGVYCTIGGRTALNKLQDVTNHAMANIALGSCATDGGLAGTNPNPTDAVGVKGAIPDIQNLINLPGCPANVVNLVAGGC